MKRPPKTNDRGAWIDFLKSLGDKQLAFMYKALCEAPSEDMINGFAARDWVDMIVTARYELAGFE